MDSTEMGHDDKLKAKMKAIYLNLKNAIPKMLLDNFLCVVLIFGFPSLIQAYD